jgi:hypothetical protein
VYLVTFDVTGIQRYVFGSNRIADNIGASVLVDRAMREWTAEAVDDLRLNPEGAGDPDEWLDAFSDGRLAAAFVRRTGGGAQLVVRSSEQAREIVSRVTERVLREAAGMQVVADVSEWPEGEPYAVANDRASAALAAMKSRRVASRFPDLPGVVERCQVTAETASVVRDGERISLGVEQRREVKDEEGEGGYRSLREAAERAKRRGRGELRDALARMRSLDLRFVNDLDRIRGDKHETSYVAVVHVDANGMGRAFREIAKKGEHAVACTSLDVDAASTVAIAAAIDWICDRIDSNASPRSLLGDQVRLYRTPSGGWALPLRPIVGAGDDLTVVCEGKISLHVAEAMTRAYRDALRRVSGFATAGACAGVGLGLAHAPFWQLYELAEAGCKAGKTKARAQKAAGESYLAYRFLDDADPIRRRSVEAFRLCSETAELDDWRWFVDACLEPCQRAADDVRSQLKGLLGDLIANDGRERARQSRWAQRELAISGLFSGLASRFGAGRPARDPRINALELMDFVYRDLEEHA